MSRRRSIHLFGGLLAFAGFWAVFGWVPDSEAGVEARCNELGSNCLCSERFNVPTYNANNVNSGYKQPSDIGSNPKPCSTELEKYPIATSLSVSGVNSGPAFTTLPPGHSVSYVMQLPMDYEASVFYGNSASWQGDPFTKRLAARWYVNHVRNAQGFFDFNNINESGNTCTASKLGEIGASTLLEHSQGNAVSLRGMQSWVPFIDCCSSGPGPDSPWSAGGPDWWKNVWTRVEVVIVNTGGGAYPTNSWRAEVYIKRLKAGDPEYTAIDTKNTNTAVCNPVCNGWDNTINHTPWERTNKLWGDNFRSANGGGNCRGTYAVSHYMMAGWNTDAGQRIGAAAELEGNGGGGDTTPPIAPSGLRVLP